MRISGGAVCHAAWRSIALRTASIGLGNMSRRAAVPFLLVS